jgi:hypothetical protein
MLDALIMIFANTEFITWASKFSKLFISKLRIQKNAKKTNNREKKTQMDPIRSSDDGIALVVIFL